MGTAKIFRRGFLEDNPVFVQAIALCPTLAVTTSAENGLGMGLASTFVMVCSCVALSLIRKLIPTQVRIPCHIVIIASFATVVQFLLEGFFPDLNASLGIFIPLIVVNCIILARVESFATKHGPFLSMVDGLSMGLGFTLALVVVGAVRELFGDGKIFGLALLPAEFPKTIIMILPPGAFFTMGLMIAGLHHLKNRKALH